MSSSMPGTCCASVLGQLGSGFKQSLSVWPGSTVCRHHLPHQGDRNTTRKCLAPHTMEAGLLQPAEDVPMWDDASFDQVFDFLFEQDDMSLTTDIALEPQTFEGLYQSWQEQPPPQGTALAPAQHSGRVITSGGVGRPAPAPESTKPTTINTYITATHSTNHQHQPPAPPPATSKPSTTSSYPTPTTSTSQGSQSEDAGLQPAPHQAGMSWPEGGWQSLLHYGLKDTSPAELQATSSPKKGRTGKGPPAGGCTVKKPARDKKRENTILIKQLEAQMANKLNIVKQLEGQNTELKQKERLLKLSLDTSEVNMNRLANPQLGSNLKHMLQSFRGAYNRPAAERALAKIANVTEPKDMTFEVFRSCWQALVMEMCDSLMRDSVASSPQEKQEAERYLQELHDRSVAFVMALCLESRTIIIQAQVINLATGEEHHTENSFWEGVIDKMAPNDDQMRDMAGAWEMNLRLQDRNLAERAVIKDELAAAVAAEAAERESGTAQKCDPVGSAVEQASDRLNANLIRQGTVATLVTFTGLRVLDYRQTAHMCIHSSPLFPSVHRMLAIIHQRALAKGLMRRAT